MFREIKINDGRMIPIDVEPLNAHQTELLLEGVVDLLVRSGLMRADAVPNGPQILMMVGDLATSLDRSLDD